MVVGRLIAAYFGVPKLSTDYKRKLEKESNKNLSKDKKGESSKK